MKKTMKKAVALLLTLILFCGAIGISAYATSGNIDMNIIAETSKVAVNIEREGVVLLKNEDNALPLNNAKLNIFGVGSAFPYIGGTGSGCTTSDNPVYLYDALDKAGVEYNKELRKLYEANGGKSDLPYVDHTIINNLLNLALLQNAIDEMDPKKLTQKVMDNAKAYSDTALIVIGRTGTENSDISMDTLRLSKNEKAMVEKVCSTFSKVIVMFNTGNVMEMGWLDEYDSVKAALEVWIPGEFGFEGVVDVLTGKVNPSGRLNDTIAYKLADYPSTENFGDYTFKGSKDKYVEYMEGIYVGYRYFETMAKDKVQFPFGYGLSYTTFEQSITDKKCSEDEISVTVKVTNTGDVAGKDVVQLYYCPPYINGGIEKSAIVLAAFDKTDVLKAGESQTLTLTFNVRDMASYDYKNAQAYVLDSGDYKICLGKNVREHYDSFTYTVNDTVVYNKDAKTGTAIKNLFDFAYSGFTVFSRSNPKGTYPKSRERQATDEIKKADSLPEPVKEGTAPKTGVKYDKTITLQDVAKDESLWDKFLDQFTLDEMCTMVGDGGYETAGVDRLGVPHTFDDDGPLSVKGRNGTVFSDSGTAYPNEVCVACTWNIDLAEAMGEGAAKEAYDMGVDVWYAPGVNIHRTPTGGRNYEYYSEDPYISGKMAAAVIRGCNKGGLVTTIKHFAMNDQETNRGGISTWADEQTIREIYLKPFEIAIKECEPLGVMSAYNRIGAQWCGGCSALLKGMLREEWGFNGFVVSDYSSNFTGSGYMSPAVGVYNGNDVMLTGIYALQKPSTIGSLKAAYKRDPIGFGTALREATKHTCQMKIHTFIFNNPRQFPDAGRLSNWFIDITSWKWESPFTVSALKYALSNIVNGFCWIVYKILM
ncbi:MAG: glycoside hydrolase family 3 C-terminal domain-containing protein [Clostridia bacterium]|nr:glycoside hydrolase family 3 C-terminal domain-containing protein [Clostridia bacterium]